MTTATLADALAASTATEIRDQALDDLIPLGASLVGVNTESADRGLIELFARAQAAEQGYRSTIARASSKALLMETITDLPLRLAWLSLMAKGWFGLDLLPSTRATHRIRLVASAGAGPYPIAPRALLVQTDDAIQFRNTGRLTSDTTAAPGTITLTAAGTRDDLEWEAVLPGTAGNIPIDSALTLVTTLAGVAASNPQIGSTGSSLLTSGADAETAESLSLRCDARWGRTAVGQLLGALVEWIFESFAVQGITCPVTKWAIDDTNPNGPGSTDVYIYPGTVGNLATVGAYLAERRGVGRGPLRTLAAEVLTVPFTAELHQLGFSTTNEADANDSIGALSALIPIGGTVYGDDITKALRMVQDLIHVTHSLDGITTTAGVYQVIELDPTFTVI